jgi:hypothetical protein
MLSVCPNQGGGKTSRVLPPGSTEDGAAAFLTRRPLDGIAPLRLALSPDGDGTTTSASAADFLGAESASTRIWVTPFVVHGPHYKDQRY